MTVRPESTSKPELVARDRSHLIHSLHNSLQTSGGHVWVKGHGAVLTDADGKEYIDGLSGDAVKDFRT